MTIKRKIGFVAYFDITWKKKIINVSMDVHDTEKDDDKVCKLFKTDRKLFFNNDFD